MPGDNGLGHGAIAPQMLFKNPPSSIMGYQNPQAFNQLSQPINPFASSQQTRRSPSHSHLPLMEALAQPVLSAQENPLPLIEAATEEAKPLSGPPPPTSTSKKRKRKEKRESERKASRAEPIPVVEYDETLLAIVGILNEVKHQSNVASWVKGNGLWGPYPPRNPADPNIDPPTQGYFRKSREDIATSSDSGSGNSGRHGEGKKKRRNAVSAFFEASVMEGAENGGSPNAPTSEKSNQTDVSETPLWFDNPPTMRYWVDRGRNALETLGVPIEHGLKQ